MQNENNQNLQDIQLEDNQQENSFPVQNDVQFHQEFPDSDNENSQKSQPLQAGEHHFQGNQSQEINQDGYQENQYYNNDQNYYNNYNQHEDQDYQQQDYQQEQRAQEDKYTIDMGDGTIHNYDNFISQQQQNSENINEELIQGLQKKVSVQEKIGELEDKMTSNSQIKLVQIPEIFDPFGPVQINKDAEIIVSKAAQKQTGMKKYTAYLICTQENGSECQLFRRFSEFQALRTALLERFPGCCIPSLPEKQSLEITNLQPPTTIEIIETLGQQFSHLQGFDLSDDVVNQMKEFSAQLEQCLPKLKYIINYLKQLADLKDKYDQNITSLFEFCLSGYETCNFSEYVEKDNSKLIVSNKNLTYFQNLKDKIMKQGSFNPYRLIYECMQNELFEIESLQEVIQQKEETDKKKHATEQQILKNQEEVKKLQSGKSGKSFLSSKNPEEKIAQLEKQIQTQTVEKENLQKLSDIILAIVTLVEFKQFKQNKKRNYERILKLVSSSEINKSQEQIEFWKCFGKYANEFTQMD